MMAKATYEGLVERDQGKLRPFVLSRSVFLGSQKYGAKWTGDNHASYSELALSINQLLSLSISGIAFVGADIPGFYGRPTDELYILFYQLGVFFPFTRAHSHIDAFKREPFRQVKIV